MDKEQRIAAEFERIGKLFSKADSSQWENALPLLENAAFMKVTLEDLQQEIIRDGATEQYRNGETQYGVKQSAALQSYNTTIKNYAAVIRTISQMLPPAVEGENRLQAFMRQLEA